MIPDELIERFVELGHEPRRQYRTVLDARRRAPAQIQLILSAVRDGKLKIPGEVDRIRITLLGLRHIVTTENAFDWGGWCEKQCRKGANQFIALREQDR